VWNADESRILTTANDNTAQIWDAISGEQLLSLSGHTDWLTQALWNADGSQIVTASALWHK
jgi:WD40 repeat protein